MKNFKYYLPWYWPIWFIIFIFWLLLQLPYRAQLFLGKCLGLIILRFSKKSRHITQVNLNLCFPELNKKEKEKLLRDCFINIGISVFETGLAFIGGNNKVKKLVTVHGDEHFTNAAKRNKGVLLLGAHFTTIELIGCAASLKYKFSVMYRPHKIGFLNFIIERALKKFYYRAIPRHALRDMIRALKEKQIVWYSADVNAGRKASVFAPFFGIQAATVKAVSRFAELTDCEVLPFFHYRRADHTGYDAYIFPPLENFPSGDFVADATRINKIIEEAVRKCPEQYLWQYMRFKTRPLGEARLYKKK